MTTYLPEKLNLWDKIFNRYKKIPVERDTESWINANHNIRYSREFVVYHVIHRSTGSYTIKKEFLD